MLRSAAVARIKQGLGFRTDLDDVIISALQEAQRNLEGATTYPWFLAKEDQSLSFTAPSQSASFPSDFLGLHEDEGLRYVDSDSNVTWLVKKPFDEAKEYYKDAPAGPPVAYTRRSTSIMIWPVPDINYTLTWSYYGRGVLLDTDVTNVWLTAVPELLIGFAGMTVAADLENETATNKFAKMYTMWAAWLTQEMARREEDGNPRAMGRNN